MSSARPTPRHRPPELAASSRPIRDPSTGARTAPAHTFGWMIIERSELMELWETPEGVRHWHKSTLGPLRLVTRGETE